MSDKEKNYLIETMTTDMIMLLMNDTKTDLPSAFDMVYNSETYQKMCNPETKLMFRSPVYVYSYLKNEIQTGRMS